MFAWLCPPAAMHSAKQYLSAFKITCAETGFVHFIGFMFWNPVLCLVPQSCLALCDPMDCSLPGSSVHGGSPGKNPGMGCHALLQGIFPIQGSNPGLLQCRQILYHLSYQESPRILEWVACPFSRGSSQPRNQTGISCIAGRFFTS